MCEITALRNMNSDFTHFFEDGTKSEIPSEMKPPLFTLFTSKGSFNNYVDKHRGRGVKSGKILST